MTYLEIIEELYRAFREQDYDVFLTLCSDDLQWIQNKGFPGGATHSGAQAVVDHVFRSFGNDWKSFIFEIDEMHEAGNTIIVLGRYLGENKNTRKTFSSSCTHVFDFNDGKVARFRQFADTKVIWDAMSEVSSSG